MTTLGPLRASLLNEYMSATNGKTIGKEDSPVPLAQDYLQFLLNRHITPITDTPEEWAGNSVARVLASLPGPNGPRHRPAPWAEYTPSPYANDHPRHRGQVWPWVGDLVVFGPGHGSPHGTLGIYLDHEPEPGTLWNIFTQGFGGPAEALYIDTRDTAPIGWWRVTDARLQERNTMAVIP